MMEGLTKNHIRVKDCSTALCGVEIGLRPDAAVAFKPDEVTCDHCAILCLMRYAPLMREVFSSSSPYQLI